MKLFRYYRKAVVRPSLFVLFFCIVYSIVDNYKSEWHTAGTAILMSVITSVIYTLIMCMVSLTIFLNKFQKLSKNILWNILTWFLLPAGYIVIVLINDIKNRINFDLGFGQGFIYLLIMIIPFVISMVATFIKYRQQIKTIHIL
jgi:hypothetical protein